MFGFRLKTSLIAGVAGLLMVGALPAHNANAGAIAVFGDNATDDFINGLAGHTATLVSDAQIATAGFLSAFDAFYYTRLGASFGVSLSAAAAANVQSFVGGNIVLLNCDCADALPGDATIAQLTSNAVSFAAMGGGGYIGEFSGAVAGLTSNSDGFAALGLISGSAGSLGVFNGGSDGSMVIAAAGVGHPVLAGVGLPYNPGAVEFGASITGVNAAQVLATWSNSPNSPAVIALSRVPEPGTLAIFGLGLAGLGFARRRKAA